MTKMYLKVSMNVNLSDIVTKIFTIFQSCISKQFLIISLIISCIPHFSIVILLSFMPSCDRKIFECNSWKFANSFCLQCNGAFYNPQRIFLNFYFSKKIWICFWRNAWTNLNYSLKYSDFFGGQSSEIISINEQFWLWYTFVRAFYHIIKNMCIVKFLYFIFIMWKKSVCS